jgi:hypothetical protein
LKLVLASDAKYEGSANPDLRQLPTSKSVIDNRRVFFDHVAIDRERLVIGFAAQDDLQPRTTSGMSGVSHCNMGGGLFWPSTSVSFKKIHGKLQEIHTKRIFEGPKTPQPKLPRERGTHLVLRAEPCDWCLTNGSHLH